jgi:hypothetical protein
MPVVARVKTIDVSSLVPVRKERKPSAKQLALMKREASYSAAISKLQRGQALQFEPSDGEKTPTIRASLQRVIDTSAARTCTWR